MLPNGVRLYKETWTVSGTLYRSPAGWAAVLVWRRGRVILSDVWQVCDRGGPCCLLRTRRRMVMRCVEMLQEDVKECKVEDKGRDKKKGK